MSGIEHVLERLIVDEGFRREFARDLHAAVTGYALSTDEMELFASQLDEEAGGGQSVEQRTSQSTLVALMGMVGGGGMTSYDDPIIAADPEVSKPADILVGKITPKGESPVASILDLAGSEDEAQAVSDGGQASSGDNEWKYVPVRRLGEPAPEDLAAASHTGPALNAYAALTPNGTALNGSEIAMEELVVQNEGWESGAADDTAEVAASNVHPENPPTYTPGDISVGDR
jgi:hypothetical protein